jgi:hypothetical protein
MMRSLLVARCSLLVGSLLVGSLLVGSLLVGSLLVRITSNEERATIKYQTQVTDELQAKLDPADGLIQAVPLDDADP